MAGRILTVDGHRWGVAVSGRPTQYQRDEFGVVFTSLDDGSQRISRYSPQAVKSPERSLVSLTDPRLIELFRRSQPSWTSPELGYRR